MVSVEGDVRVRRAGSTQWVPIDGTATLAAEDVVQAMESGSARIELVASGATLALKPSTTVEIPRPPTDPLAVAGRMVVRVSSTTTPAELRLRLPPGTLLLRAAPGGDAVVEATVEVSAARSVVEMKEGRATINARAGGDIAIGYRSWVRFRPDGTVEDAGTAGAMPVLLAPLPDEYVRTAGLVDLSWEPLEGADGYAVEIHRAETVRRIESRRTTIRTAFESGDYEWTVRGLSGGVAWPAAPVRAMRVEVDAQPPVLTVAQPRDHAKVIGPTLRFAGTSEPAATILIGAKRTQANARGQFSIDVPISRGLSNLVIRARDDLGNERTMTRSVVWE